MTSEHQMTRLSRRRFAGIAAAGAAGLGGPAVVTSRAIASPPDAAPERRETLPETINRYAEATWECFVAMVDEGSGLPTDRLRLDGFRAVQTSTTNTGAYLWSAVAAERLGMITRSELVARLRRTLDTLERIEKHEPTGLYFNWYDHRTGEKLTEWPDSGDPMTPHLSSVDNGWLATGLRVVRGAVEEVADQAGRIYDGMDFGIYYDEESNRLIRTYVPSSDSYPCCYDTLGEVRIASWLGIGNGQIPAEHYFGAYRTFPGDTCEFGWQQMKPYGEWTSYLGVDLFQGAYRYGDIAVTPNWGGSAFEALMVPLFVPEEIWGPRSWKVNHPAFLRGQIHHGLREAEYGYWGFSPCDVPEGGYKAYGVPWLGMNPTGYPSNNDDTFPDPGFAGCREAQPLPGPEDYTNGVVTPHASALGIRWATGEVVRNLRNLERDFEIYHPQWGFRDSVNVQTGVCAEWFLSLDQGMIMAALANHLTGDYLREAFVSADLEDRLRPLMEMETFANYSG